MRRAVGTALVALMLVSAGCSGFLDSGDSPEDGAPGTAPEITVPPTTAPQTPTPSAQEQEYLTSGKEFTRVMALRLNRTHEMYLTERGFYRNNTVSMSYRLDEGSPLYKSIMNVSQTVSVIIPIRTTADESMAMENGRDGKIHRPEKIYVQIVDDGGELIGKFQIDPTKAYRYRLYELDADIFAQDVVDSLELERDVVRGGHSPGWYLNRSQLYDWSLRYAATLRQDTNPNETVYEEKFPIEGIEVIPGEMRVHHELMWDSKEMGQDVLSGHSAISEVYYMTVDDAWAMSPRRLSFYFHRPDGVDIEGHMDLKSVLWLLEKDNPQEYMNEYLLKAETETVDDE
jgi:hypothetical protein